MVMKTRGKSISRKAKAKSRKLLTLCMLSLVAMMLLGKITEPRIVGYTYDTGSTVWEMAARCCPERMDTQEVVKEIEKLNGITDSVVCDGMEYKVPIYE